jgi:phage terminase Nu1 subunit (DNA packaging protein)
MDADKLNKQQLLDIVAQQSEKIAALEQQLRLLLNRQFGRKSEAVSADQLNLFSPDDAPAPNEDTSDDVETVTVSAHTKNRGKRKPLDADLERQSIHYELPEDQRQCDCGDTLKDIGTQTSEQIDFIPARVVVVEHVQHKYACSCCQTAVRIAPKPAQPLPKSNAAPG